MGNRTLLAWLGCWLLCLLEPNEAASLKLCCWLGLQMRLQLPLMKGVQGAAGWASSAAAGLMRGLAGGLPEAACLELQTAGPLLHESCMPEAAAAPVHAPCLAGCAAVGQAVPPAAHAVPQPCQASWPEAGQQAAEASAGALNVAWEGPLKGAEALVSLCCREQPCSRVQCWLQPCRCHLEQRGPLGIFFRSGLSAGCLLDWGAQLEGKRVGCSEDELSGPQLASPVQRC